MSEGERKREKEKRERSSERSGRMKKGLDFNFCDITLASIPLWDFFGGVGFQMWRSAWLVSNAPAMKYTNPIDRGFTLIRATSEEMVAEYYYLGSNVAPDYRSNTYPYGSEGIFSIFPLKILP